MTIRDLVDQLTDTAKMVGWDGPVLVETERGGDPGTPLVVKDVEPMTGDPAEELPDSALIITQEQDAG